MLHRPFVGSHLRLLPTGPNTTVTNLLVPFTCAKSGVERHLRFASLPHLFESLRLHTSQTIFSCPVFDGFVYRVSASNNLNNVRTTTMDKPQTAFMKSLIKKRDGVYLCQEGCGPDCSESF